MMTQAVRDVLGKNETGIAPAGDKLMERLLTEAVCDRRQVVNRTSEYEATALARTWVAMNTGVTFDPVVALVTQAMPVAARDIMEIAKAVNEGIVDPPSPEWWFLTPTKVAGEESVYIVPASIQALIQVGESYSYMYEVGLVIDIWADVETGQVIDWALRPDEMTIEETGPRM